MLNALACLLCLALGLNALPAHGAEPMVFIHPPPENAGDQRLTYYWELLEAALQTNKSKYGPYRIVSSESAASFQRAAAEVESGQKGRINIVARATSLDLEARLHTIPIPLDKGLTGYRLFLVMPETQEKLAAAKSLDDLQKLSIGQASSWADVKILEANKLEVALAANYENLFPMLGAHRFDLLARGVNEILAEWQFHKDKVPGIMIEKDLMLAYPLPRYFFVPPTPEGERMAERIEDGLRRMVKSGEFERRYQAYKKLVLTDLNLSGRHVFRLSNPQLSDKAPPLNDKLWWDDLHAELAPKN